MKRNKQIEMPSQELLEVEIQRVRYRKRYNSVLRSTIYTLIVVAALAVLMVTIWLPILKIYGSSMTPTLNEGDIVVSQDYGVAAMALGKGAYGIHPSGKWYTDENIDQMLMERHLNKKARRSSKRNWI